MYLIVQFDLQVQEIPILDTDESGSEDEPDETDAAIYDQDTVVDNEV
jgi:hypothetical protein